MALLLDGFRVLPEGRGIRTLTARTLERARRVRVCRITGNPLALDTGLFGLCDEWWGRGQRETAPDSQIGAMR